MTLDLMLRTTNKFVARSGHWKFAVMRPVGVAASGYVASLLASGFQWLNSLCRVQLGAPNKFTGIALL